MPIGTNPSQLREIFRCLHNYYFEFPHSVRRLQVSLFTSKRPLIQKIYCVYHLLNIHVITIFTYNSDSMYKTIDSILDFQSLHLKIFYSIKEINENTTIHSSINFNTIIQGHLRRM